MDQQQGGPMGVNLSPDMIRDGEFRKCSCGSMLFDSTSSAVVRISKLIAMTPEDIDVPVRTMVCRGCGKVPAWSDPDNVLPKELKDVRE